MKRHAVLMVIPLAWAILACSDGGVAVTYASGAYFPI
jgi:hypothetical protein